VTYYIYTVSAYMHQTRLENSDWTDWPFGFKSFTITGDVQ